MPKIEPLHMQLISIAREIHANDLMEEVDASGSELRWAQFAEDEPGLIISDAKTTGRRGHAVIAAATFKVEDDGLRLSVRADSAWRKFTLNGDPHSRYILNAFKKYVWIPKASDFD